MKIFFWLTIPVAACVTLGAPELAALPRTVGESKVLNQNPEEVGTVRWERNHDAALAAARKSGKPVFALFQDCLLYTSPSPRD